MKKQLHKMISKAYWLKGYKIDDGVTKDIALMAKWLEKDLSEPKYSNLSLEEIDYAIEQGVKGKWGEYHGINVISLLRFINDYTRSDERVSRIKAKALPEKTEPTEKEKREILKKGVLEKFDKFCQDKDCQDYGNVSYDFLDKAGLINYTQDKKIEFMCKAEGVLREKRKESVVRDVVKSFEKDNLVSEAKRLALKEYFQNIVDVGGEEDFINEIKKL